MAFTPMMSDRSKLARAGLNQAINRLQAMTGFRINTKSDIPEHVGFREWCEQMGDAGLKIDGKPFRLDNRPALIPIYDAIPTTREEAAHKMLIIQKATQLGLTVWEILANIYMAKKWAPVSIGMFLPDQSTAAFKSEHRFMRIVKSAPEIYKEMTTDLTDEGKTKRIGEGNIMTRKLGESLFLFLWTSGKVSTESRPMDVVSLDEVQEMTLEQIDKVRARTGDSDVQFSLLLSTANMPDLDINFWYQQGTQEVWHTSCPHCGAKSDLSDPAGTFPDRSIAYNQGDYPDAPMNEYIWTCPQCLGWIEDPQQGEYIIQNPTCSPNFRSFLLPRTISPRMTPRNMIESWGRAKGGDQKKSFYNRTLARPYIDADQLPVTMAHCMAAAEAGMKLGLRWKQNANDTYMGIDQMGSFNAVIIKERLPDGRQGVVHVEAVFDIDPFARCADLMEQYGVTLCVIEQLPNVNDARKFAAKFPGRVFLAGYADLRDDAMQWGDDLSKSDRRTAEDERTRYTVTLNQYKCMQTALFRIRGTMINDELVPMCLFPDPALLEQDVIDNGKRKRIPITTEWVFHHFTKTALVVEQDEEQRKPRAKVKKIGIDPHYAYANMLCDVAWARSNGTGMMLLPDEFKRTEQQQAIAENMPGLPNQVIAMFDNLPSGSCGRCTAYNRDTSQCDERFFTVRPADPGCPFFVEID